MARCWTSKLFLARPQTILALPPPCYNIAPTMAAAALTRQDGVLALGSLNFGWRRKTGGLWINVRSETYRPTAAAQACGIVAQGFYEWHRNGDVKQPYYFQLPDRRLFALAALRRGNQFAILTRPPSAAIRPVHNRMPVILTASTLPLWLDGAVADVAALGSEALVAHAVERSVNDARHDGPDCIAPANHPFPS